MAPSKAFLAIFLTVFVILARVYIGINTAQQLIIGAFVGVIEGILFQCVIYFFIYPHFEKMINWRVATLIGLENNICKQKLKEKDLEEFLDKAYELHKMGNTISKKNYKKQLLGMLQ
jgi:hypothetical protein